MDISPQRPETITDSVERLGPPGILQACLRDPASFEAQMTSYFVPATQLFETNREGLNDSARKNLERILEGVPIYLRHIGESIFTTNYWRFAEESNLMRDEIQNADGTVAEYRHPIWIDELDENQLEMWQTYINNSTDPLTHMRADFVSALGSNNLSLWKNRYNIDVGFSLALRGAQHKMVRQLLPNMTDAEARLVFGNPIYTAGAVMESPTAELLMAI